MEPQYWAQQARSQALEAAIRTATPGAGSYQILHDAEKYRAFLDPAGDTLVDDSDPIPF